MMEKLVHVLKISLVKLYRYRFRVLSIALVGAVLLSMLHFYSNSNVASARMSLNYAEASSGLNPNSTRFNISELVSEDVMSRVIHSAGLDDRVAWDELAACISTHSVDQNKGTSNYISTSYQITYDRTKLESRPENLPSAEDMLSLICMEYKSYFLENYGDNTSILDYTPLVATDEEPYISLGSLEIKLDQIFRYLEMRIKENKSYTDEETGASFISLMKDVENLIDYDIANTYSFILETGVSRDKVRLVSLENYKNRIDKLSYDRFMEFYGADNNGIGLYDEAMSAIVMIPSVDKAREYYMSRTKTATDLMARNADSELKEASSYKKEIDDTKYVISKMREGSDDPKGNLATAVEMIIDLSTSIDSIAEKLKVLDISYIRHKTQNYLVFNYSEHSFLQKINWKRTILEVGVGIVLFYLVLITVCFKEERKKNAKV